MTDKERLEEIKEQLEESNSYDDNPNGYWYHNINYLIEQAERVQDLESEIRALRAVARSNKFIGEQYLEQNKRYRETIRKARVMAKYGDEHRLERILDVLTEALEEDLK